MERRNQPQSNAKTASATVKSRQEMAVKTPSRGCLPSGLTLLNLALSDEAKAGLPAGKIINIVGDSSAGKTFLAETCLAAIANEPEYDDYDLYLDDAEHAMEMNVGYLFGDKASERIKAPRYDKNGEPINSDTIENFFANVKRLIKLDRPFIYCLDSLDSLTDSAEVEQADALVKAAEKAEKEGDDFSDLQMPGSYGMAKSKLMSQILRTIKAGIASTGSTVIIISQVRDNIGATPWQNKKRRAGGTALEFYCSHTIWLSRLKAITKEIDKKAKKEVIGAEVEAKITKNKVTGKNGRVIEFSVYYDYGLDDIGSMIDFLLDYGGLKKKGAYIDASALSYEKYMYMDDLISAIEEDGPDMLNALIELTQEVWNKKEDALRSNRKPRFAR